MNETYSTDSPNSTLITYWTQPDWIIPVVLNIFLMIFSTWIFVCLIHYGIKTKKWKKDPMTKSIDHLSGGLVYSSAVACSVISLVENIFTQISYHVGFRGENAIVCKIVNDLQFSAYLLVIFFNFVFLWNRQRMFYVNKILNANYAKSVRAVSAFSLALIIAGGCLVIALHIVNHSYVSSPGGCVYIPASQTVVIMSLALSAVVVITAELILLSLLIHPLKLILGKKDFWHQSWSWCSSQSKPHPNQFKEVTSTSICTVTTSAVQSQQKNIPQSTSINAKRNQSPRFKSFTLTSHQKMTKSKVKTIMIRTLVFGTLTIFTDVFLIIIYATPLLDFHQPSHRRISSAFDDVNVLINLLFVIFSFSSHKRIMTTLCINYI